MKLLNVLSKIREEMAEIPYEKLRLGRKVGKS